MFAFSLNQLMARLLSIRFSRTQHLVDTAQAILNNDPEEIRKEYGRMHADETVAAEWGRLEAIKTEIEQAMGEKRHLLEAASRALTQAGKPAMDPEELELPDAKIRHLRDTATEENVYDNLQAASDLLNDFLARMVALCGAISMQLVRI